MEKKSSYLPTTTPTPPPPRSSEQEQSPSKRKRRPQGEETLSPFWKAVRNVLLFLAAIVNLGVSVWVVVEHGNLPELFPGQHDNLDAGKKTCHLPDLMPLSPEMRALMSEPTRIDCLSIANSDFRGRIFFKLDEEQRLIKREGVSIPCCYRPFYRVNDVENWIEPTKDRRYVCHNITEQVTIIPSRIEFIEVICDDGRSSYKDAFAFLRKKPEVEERIENLAKKEKEADPYGPEVEKLNLLVIGLDSTSQQNFIRRMPKSLEYVTTTLDAVRLDGYVKVGENTLPNLVPLLTGIGLEEFRELCVMKNPPMESAIHLDDCPFIWKQFQAAGYRTVYAEDEVSTGIFNLVFSHAFQQPPTDHYFRPFSVRMVTSQNVYDGFCMGPRMGIQVLFDYLEKAARTYSSPTDHLFHFTWASKLMHDDFNKLGWADGHLLRTLKTLNELGTLNRSALVLVGDHGSRKSELRKSRQGQLEDRLPVAYVILPPWFKKRYPQADENLRRNAKLITGAYDLHETFKDLMDLGKLNNPHTHYVRERKLKVAEKKGYRRGTSLFTALPPHRSCTSAGIPPAWCICYKKKKISIKSLDVHDALSFVLRNLNSALRPYHGICATLRLSKVISALKWHPDEAIEDTYSGNSAEESWKKASLLQISFSVEPKQAEFEVTVIFDPDHGWRFTEQVVRLDRYEEGSRCMENKELKKTCICVGGDRLGGGDGDDYMGGTGHDAIF